MTIKHCKFEDCANFFAAKHGGVKYCSKKCCQAQADRNFKRKHADRIRAKQRLLTRKYRSKWDEETRARKREEVRENNKKWYHALSDKERLARSRRQYESCDKKRKQKLARQNRRKLYQKNENYKMRHILRSRLRNALLNQRTTKFAPTLDLLGCTVEELKAHIEAQFEPWMTWDNWAHDTWHIDHIKPCASYDLTDPEQQRECFHYTNLRPLEATENMRKNARLNH